MQCFADDAAHSVGCASMRLDVYRARIWCSQFSVLGHMSERSNAATDTHSHKHWKTEKQFRKRNEWTEEKKTQREEVTQRIRKNFDYVGTIRERLTHIRRNTTLPFVCIVERSEADNDRDKRVRQVNVDELSFYEVIWVCELRRVFHIKDLRSLRVCGKCMDVL